MHKFIRAGIYLFLALVLVWELLALTASATGPGLERVYSDRDGTWYINAKTLVSPAGGRMSFWSTVVPVKGTGYFTELGAALEKARKNARRLEYVQTLQDVDCSTGAISTLSILYYDKLDRIMYTINVPPSAQRTRSSGPAPDRILAAVCGSQLAQVRGE